MKPMVRKMIHQERLGRVTPVAQKPIVLVAGQLTLVQNSPQFGRGGLCSSPITSEAWTHGEIGEILALCSQFHHWGRGIGLPERWLAHL